jgi:hypothetical protein
VGRKQLSANPEPRLNSHVSQSLISLTFDDALDQHLDNVVPVLDRAGFKGTFYVHLSARSLSLRMADWQQVAKAGHELGNHTIFHPADSSHSWVREGNSLNLYGIDRMQLELQVSNQWLAGLDGSTERTFAYPCCNSVLGSYGYTNQLLFRFGLKHTRWVGVVERAGLDFGSTRKSYVPITKDLFLAARGGGIYLSGQSPELKLLDRRCLPSAAVAGHTFSQMRDFVVRSFEKNSWPILQFHGVGGGHSMDCDLKEFQKLIDWLSEHHHEKVVTVANGARILFGPVPTTTSGQ